MAEPVLDVSGLSKRFCRDLRSSLAYGVADIFAELRPWSAARTDLRKNEFWALRDIDLRLHAGEALAVVGHNGAGKSTLLKTIAGLLKPDDGSVAVSGSLEAIVELGAGLNPVLTGRENVELGLSLRGCSARDVSRHIDAIADFAELDGFMDSPLQSYSSGMRARLAFALAVQLKPSLLLVDEVLAVGDMGFQRKCLQVIRRHLDDGGSLLFVSHNIFQIQTVCERGILLERGQIAFQGSALETVEQLTERQHEAASMTPVAVDGTMARIDAVELETASGDAVAGEPLEIRICYTLPEAAEVVFTASIWSRDLSVCVALMLQPKPELLSAGTAEKICRIPAIQLSGGSYFVRAGLLDPITHHPLALFGYSEPAALLRVKSNEERGALLRRHAGALVEIGGEWRDGSMPRPLRHSQ